MSSILYLRPAPALAALLNDLDECGQTMVGRNS